MAKGSVDNVLTVLRTVRPEAGALRSAHQFPGRHAGRRSVRRHGDGDGDRFGDHGEPVDNKLAMTGEISIHGNVKPVGGVIAKVEAAFQAGATKVHHPEGKLAGDF